MTTFADDFVRLHLDLGTVNLALVDAGLEWPPPERLAFDAQGFREAREEDPAGCVLVRSSCSAITDEQREGMTHVARGAEYFYGGEDPFAWQREAAS